MRTVMPGMDFMTSYTEWLSIQRGNLPSQSSRFDPTRRYIRNGRDLAQWVHVDVLFQAYFHAMLILLTPPGSTDENSAGLGVPFDSANPYATSKNQTGFGTFGGPHIAALMCEVATRALKAVWYQKWSVHRRLRPEAFAGRVHNYFSGGRFYPLAASELQGSAGVRAIFDRHGGFLLPMAFPEGSPLHPSYGAGHATVAGACVTILKAWFDESFPIPNPVVPSADGLSLVPYSGAQLTVGGELNKLASNIATGRNHAGVHWRSDAAESFKLGEAIAISILRDHQLTYNETFAGFSLTKFDGTKITI
jgi:membrane-associated phospholipid phosphatase